MGIHSGSDVLPLSTRSPVENERLGSNANFSASFGPASAPACSAHAPAAPWPPSALWHCAGAPAHLRLPFPRPRLSSAAALYMTQRAPTEQRKRMRLALYLDRPSRKGGAGAEVRAGTLNISGEGFYCVSRQPLLQVERSIVIGIPAPSSSGRRRYVNCQCTVLRLERLSNESFGIPCHIDDYSLSLERQITPRDCDGRRFNARARLGFLYK